LQESGSQTNAIFRKAKRPRALPAGAISRFWNFGKYHGALFVDKPKGQILHGDPERRRPFMLEFGLRIVNVPLSRSATPALSLQMTVRSIRRHWSAREQHGHGKSGARNCTQTALRGLLRLAAYLHGWPSQRAFAERRERVDACHNHKNLGRLSMRHSTRLYPARTAQAIESEGSSVYGGIAIIVASVAAIAFIVSVFVEPSPKLSAPGDFGLASISELSR
jgi:hypothetical protein